MAYLLTPTLEQRASRVFLLNQPTSALIYSWFYWLPNWDYTGYWTGYDTNYVENTLGATPYAAGSGSGATAARQWSLPAGIYKLHYHIEVKCDTSNMYTNNLWTKEIETQASWATDPNYYYTGSVNQVNGTVINSVKQKNVQFCSPRTNTSAIESNRAYVTFDHHLEWSQNAGQVYGIGTDPFNGAARGFVSVEDFWFILRRVR